MQNITFNMSTAHRYGTAFYDYLRLRKEFFVDMLDWEVPHDSEVEMDQYDNPTAHYSLVQMNGRVVGGARTMPTDAKWGEHTYMLRDAFKGRLDHIPASALPYDIATPKVWECTRLVISDEVDSHQARSLCLSLIVDGLMEVAQARGAEELVSLSPISLTRALRKLGYAASRLGAPYQSEGDGRRYAVLRMPSMRPSHAIAAE